MLPRQLPGSRLVACALVDSLNDEQFGEQELGDQGHADVSLRFRRGNQCADYARGSFHDAGRGRGPIPISTHPVAVAGRLSSVRARTRGIGGRDGARASGAVRASGHRNAPRFSTSTRPRSSSLCAGRGPSNAVGASTGIPEDAPPSVRD
jgi:hypothetical protein